MAQVIIMAKHYKKSPSEILNIENDYLAYCFDEAALFLETQSTNEKGELNFDKIKWKDNKKKSNKDLIKFIMQHK